MSENQSIEQIMISKKIRLNIQGYIYYNVFAAYYCFIQYSFDIKTIYNIIVTNKNK